MPRTGYPQARATYAPRGFSGFERLRMAQKMRALNDPDPLRRETSAAALGVVLPEQRAQEQAAKDQVKAAAADQKAGLAAAKDQQKEAARQQREQEKTTATEKKTQQTTQRATEDATMSAQKRGAAAATTAISDVDQQFTLQGREIRAQAAIARRQAAEAKKDGRPDAAKLEQDARDAQTAADDAGVQELEWERNKLANRSKVADERARLDGISATLKANRASGVKPATDPFVTPDPSPPKPDVPGTADTTNERVISPQTRTLAEMHQQEEHAPAATAAQPLTQAQPVAPTLPDRLQSHQAEVEQFTAQQQAVTRPLEDVKAQIRVRGIEPLVDNPDGTTGFAPGVTEQEKATLRLAHQAVQKQAPALEAQAKELDERGTALQTEAEQENARRTAEITKQRAAMPAETRDELNTNDDGFKAAHAEIAKLFPEGSPQRKAAEETLDAKHREQHEAIVKDAQKHKADAWEALGKLREEQAARYEKLKASGEFSDHSPLGNRQNRDAEREYQQFEVEELGKKFGMSPEQAADMRSDYEDTTQWPNLIGKPADKSRVLKDGRVVVNPTLWTRPDDYVAAVNALKADPEQKKAALDALPELREKTSKQMYDVLQGNGVFKDFLDQQPGDVTEKVAALIAKQNDNPNWEWIKGAPGRGVHGIEASAVGLLALVTGQLDRAQKALGNNITTPVLLPALAAYFENAAKEWQQVTQADTTAKTLSQAILPARAIGGIAEFAPDAAAMYLTGGLVESADWALRLSRAAKTGAEALEVLKDASTSMRAAALTGGEGQEVRAVMQLGAARGVQASEMEAIIRAAGSPAKALEGIESAALRSTAPDVLSTRLAEGARQEVGSAFFAGKAGGNTYTEAVTNYEKQGATPEEARAKALLPTLSTAALTYAIFSAPGSKGLASMFQSKETTKKLLEYSLKEAAKDVGVHSLTGAAQMGLDSLAGDIVAKMSYDKDRDPVEILQQAWEAALTGAAFGWFMRVFHHAAARIGAKGEPKPGEPTADTGSEAEPPRPPEPSSPAEAAAGEAKKAASEAELVGYARQSLAIPTEQVDASIARAKVLRDIAQGRPLDDLENGELAAIGMQRSDTGEIKPAKGKDALPPAVSVENGQPIILQPALDEMERQFPATRSLIGMSEREARAKINSPIPAPAPQPATKPGQPPSSQLPAVNMADWKPVATLGSPIVSTWDHPTLGRIEFKKEASGKPSYVHTDAKGVKTTVPGPSLKEAIGQITGVTSPVTAPAPTPTKPNVPQIPASEQPSGVSPQSQAVPAKSQNVPQISGVTDSPAQQALTLGKAWHANVHGGAKTKAAAKDSLFVNLLSRALDRKAAVFPNVRFIDMAAGRAGAQLMPDGALEIDLPKLAAHVGRVAVNSAKTMEDFLQKVIQEEAEHRVFTERYQHDPEFRAKVDAVWPEVPAQLKKQSADAYHASSGGGSFDNDFQAIAEFIRQYNAKPEFAAEVEQSLAQSGLLGKWKALVQAFLDALRDFQRQFPKVAAQLNEIVADVRAALERLEGKEDLTAKEAKGELEKRPATARKNRTVQQSAKTEEAPVVTKPATTETDKPASAEKGEKLKSNKASVQKTAPPTKEEALAKAPKSSTQLTLSKDDARPIMDFASSIPKAELYSEKDAQGKEDYGAETEPHITVLYGLTNHGAGAPSQMLAKFGPVTVTLGKLSVFENDKYDVLRVDASGDQLHAMHAALKKLPHHSTFPDYRPHMTIAYLKKGEGAKYVGDARFEGQKLTFNTVTHSPPSEIREKQGRKEMALAKPANTKADQLDRAAAKVKNPAVAETLRKKAEKVMGKTAETPSAKQSNAEVGLLPRTTKLRRGDMVEVLNGPLKGVRKVEGYDLAPNGKVFVENPETKMHDAVESGNFKVLPKQESSPKPPTTPEALDFAEQRKTEGKSQLSVARELGDMGLSDGDATGIAGQVFAKAAEETPTVAESAPDKGKVADFGEKLGGARKDRVTTVEQELSDDEIAGKTLSEIWPKSEIDSIEDIPRAALATATRDVIPTKPQRGYKLAAWVAKVKLVKTIMRHVQENGMPWMMERLGSPEYRLSALADKIGLLQQVDRAHWGRIGTVENFPNAYSYSADGKTQIPAPHATAQVDKGRVRAESLGKLADVVNARVSGEKPGAVMQFEVRGVTNGKTGTGTWRINKKGDPLYRPLKVFKDVEAKEALAFIRSNHADLVTAWGAVKERDNVKESDLRRATNRPRRAEDYRNGKDATPEMFQQAFGFRGVEFGNWVTQGANAKERQGMMNEAFDAMHDLAGILKLPTRALSLNGELGLGFGSRGHGWASAHYEPGNLVINLTKTRGAGSLAHELFHALDHYFQRQRGASIQNGRGAYLTEQPEARYVNTKTGHTLSIRRWNEIKGGRGRINNEADWKLMEGVRPEVEEAFAALVKALDDSPMAKRAALNDKGKTGYWGSVIERAARAFENYVIFKMQQQGYHNDYLANVTKIEDFARDPGRYPYLLEDEIAPVAEAFDNLFSKIQTNETDKGIALSTPSSESSNPIDADKITRILDGTYEPGEEDHAAVRSFERAVRNDKELLAAFGGTLPRARPLPPVPTRPQQIGAAIVAQLSGGRIVFFDPEGGVVPGAGLYDRAAQNAIAVHAVEDKRAHLIAGHELWHWLSDVDKPTARAIGALIEGLVPAHQLELAAEPHKGVYDTAGKAVQEVAANIFSSVLTDPAFWAVGRRANADIARALADEGSFPFPEARVIPDWPAFVGRVAEILGGSALQTAPSGDDSDEAVASRLEEQAKALEGELTDEEMALLDEFYASGYPAAGQGTPAKHTNDTKGEAPAPPQTSLKNAVVDVERASRGLPPLVNPIVQSWGEAGAHAARILEEHPQAGYQLVARLKLSPYALQPWENALLLLYKVNVRHDLHKAAAVVNSTADDSEENRQAKERYDQLAEAQNDIDTYAQKAGTESGRSLAARKMMRDEDMSAESLKQKYRTEVNLGRPLTDEQAKLVDRHALALAHAQQELDKVDEQTTTAEAEKGLQRLANDVAKRGPRKGNGVKKALADKVKDARARLAAIFSPPLSTPLSTAASEPKLSPANLADLATVGAGYIEDGAETAEAFTKALVKEFGEGIKPHASAIFKGAQKVHQETLAEIEAAQKPAGVLRAGKARLEGAAGGEPDLRLLTDLATAYIRAGVSSAEAMTTAITADIQDIYPGATESDVRTVLSGYGKVSKPTKDEVLRKLSEYKAQLRLIESIEDAKANEMPLKSGFQRGPQSQRVRALNQELHSLMRRMHIETTSEEQLASARKSVVSRLTNQIEDLNAIIKGKARPTEPRQAIAYDAEMNALLKERNELKSYVDELTGPSPELAWNQRAQQAAKTSAEYYRRRIAANDVATKKGPIQPENDETKKVRAEALKAKEEFEALREASGIPQRELLARTKAQIEGEIAKATQRLITGEKPATGQKRAPTVELQGLREKLNNLRKALRMVEGGKKWTDTQRAQQAAQSAQRSIDELTRRIEGGKAKPKPEPAPETPELKELRQTRDFLKEIYASLKEAEHPRRLPEEIALSNFRKRITQKRLEIEAGLKNNEYKSAEKLPPEWQARKDTAQYQLDKEKAAWYRELFERKQEMRDAQGKVLGAASELQSAQRAIMTSCDFSAVMRQGGLLSLAMPKEGAIATAKMLQAFWSEEAQHRAFEQIKRNPEYEFAKECKLYIADINDASMTKLEEQYQTRMIEGIRGWKGAVIGALAGAVRGGVATAGVAGIGAIPGAAFGALIGGTGSIVRSERSFVTFINVLRMGAFETLVKTLGRDGRATKDEGRAIANMVNVLTGRGLIGFSEYDPFSGNIHDFDAGALLPKTFFAPLLAASRVNLLALQPLIGIHARHSATGGWREFVREAAHEVVRIGPRRNSHFRTQWLIAKILGHSLIGLGLLASMAYMAWRAWRKDDDKKPFMVLDPRSTSFGDMRFGNTRFNIFSGLTAPLVRLSQLTLGERKTAKGEVRPIRDRDRPLDWARAHGLLDEKPLGKMKFGDLDAFDTISNYGRSKAAPVVGNAINVLGGKDYIGNPTSLSREALDSVLPLGLSGLADTMVDDGADIATAQGFAEMFGISAQHYDENAKRDKDMKPFEFHLWPNLAPTKAPDKPAPPVAPVTQYAVPTLPKPAVATGVKLTPMERIREIQKANAARR